MTDLGGLHAQVMSSAELIAWSRVEALAPEDVRVALWEERTLVKTWAMRGTLHLLPAREFPTYVAALRTRQGYRRASWLKYFNITLEEMDAIIEGVRVALDGRCLTREQLSEAVGVATGFADVRERLRSGWGEFLKPAASNGYLCFGPNQGQAVTFVRPDQWLGTWHEADSDEAIREVLRRYLTTYGPATRDDFARWFGWEPKDARSLFLRMAGELVEVDMEGRKAMTLASIIDEQRAFEATPSGVRLLPAFDPYTIAYYPDSRYLDPDKKDRVYRKGAWITPVVLVNGRIEGLWEQEKKSSGTIVRVEMFQPPRPEVRSGIEAEAERLGMFLDTRVELDDRR
ncbi:MAG: winged helix DNA-binding domain-containing protein [Chloroflexota bacterium]|nr:winged helix DNA-binding domain-containing protein [Chloroflexota bacterium]MDQ5867093.1 winged helix DNA-binding domain-containing protein [Chloroflexota bacterium]